MKNEGLVAILVCALLIVLAGMHRATFYGLRSLIALSASAETEASGEAGSGDEAGKIYRRVAQASAWAPLAGALVISLLGARWALVAGGGLLVLAQLLFFAGSVRSLAALAAFALAHGLLVTATPLLAARQVAPGRRALTLALFFGLYFGINLGASQGPMVAGWASTALGFSKAFLVLGGPALVVMGAALAVVFLGRNTHTPSPPAELRPRALGVLVLALGVSIYWIAFSAGAECLGGVFQAARAQGKDLNWYWSYSTGILLAMNVLAAVLCLAAASGRRRLPAGAIWVGAGLILGAVAVLLHVPALEASTPPAGILVLLILASVGAELLLLPALVAAASGFSERVGAWVVAGYLLLTGSLVYTQPGEMLAEQGGTGLVAISALLLVAGAAMLAFRARLSGLLGEGDEAG